MKKIDLSKHFEDKVARLKWVPCNRPKDYRVMREIDQEMRLVQLEFAHKSAQSIALARHMVLRRGRSG